MSKIHVSLYSKGRPKVQRGGQKPVTQRSPDGLSRPPGIEDAIGAVTWLQGQKPRRDAR